MYNYARVCMDVLHWTHPNHTPPPTTTTHADGGGRRDGRHRGPALGRAEVALLRHQELRRCVLRCCLYGGRLLGCSASIHPPTYPLPPTLPPKKTPGTAAFALFGFLVSLGLLAWFHAFALLPAALTLDVVLRVGAVSVACALIELVPLGDDNVTVPAAAALLSMLLLR